MAPAPSNGKTVLITGINGYIASVIGLQILQKGYHLRGTTRRASSMEPLLNGPYKDYASRIQIFEVADITAPGAFDEAVAAVHGIFHVASPVDFSINIRDKVLQPAIAGSVGVLQSAFEHAGPQLETFVFTSSVTAVIDGARPSDHEYTERDWNETIIRIAEEEGPTGSPPIFYMASKVLAEKAVWEFRDKHQPPFTISAILPGVVIGPPVQLSADPSKLNATLQLFWSLFSGEQKTIPPPFGSGSFIDVRDVAKIHIWALEHPKEASGERYLAVAEFGHPQAIVDILRSSYPERRDVIPEGQPGVGYEANYRFPKGEISVSGRKVQEAVGLEWITLPQSVNDTAKTFEKYL